MMLPFGPGRLRRVPDAPLAPLRDPWPGSPARGARLMRGVLEAGGAEVALAPGGWAGVAAADRPAREAAHGFAWLRDLRAIGTDGARQRARALVAEWIGKPPTDGASRVPAVQARRAAAWLSHYDFFAASAEDEFRQALMRRLAVEARQLAGAVPAEKGAVAGLVTLRGLLALAVALGDGGGALLGRAMRALPLELERQVLPDGGHAERSPSAQLAALRELVEMKLILQAAGTAPPVALAACLDRMCPALRAVRHGDGGLALFNSSDEEDGTLVDLVLAQAGRGRAVHSSLPDAGFERLQAGRTVLVMDTGVPAPPGLDGRAAAGTLGFEMSVGRERMIVNCGAVTGPEPWRLALRATAAHATLVVADTSSSEVRADGLGRRPGRVVATRQSNGGAHWLEASHDGWRVPFGAVHHRRLYLAETGEDLRGEDAVECEGDRAYAIRFHLHPAVEAVLEEDGQSALIRFGSGALWRFRADGAPLALEDSVYAGSGARRPSRQLVLQSSTGTSSQVRWAVTRVG